MADAIARVHHLQIERVIKRYKSLPPDAEFYWHGWKICTASFGNQEFEDSIRLTVMNGLSLEQASAVSIALSMALDWIAEEQVK